MYPHIRITIAVIMTILTSSNFVFTQSKVGLKGSFMVGAICSDGIMIATESRGNFYNLKDKNTTPLAYFDGIQKTFIVGNSVLAETGNGMYGQYFICTIVEEYVKYTNPIPETSKLIDSFLLFCRGIMDNETYSMISKNQFIAAGYENNIPIISLYNGLHKEQNGLITVGLIESDKSSIHNIKPSTFTCEKFGELTTKAIYKYATDKNKQSTIGGDVAIIKIDKNKHTWLKNEPKCKWRTLDDFFKSYQIKKASLIFTSKENKKILDDLLK